MSTAWVAGHCTSGALPCNLPLWFVLCNLNSSAALGPMDELPLLCVSELLCTQLFHMRVVLLAQWCSGYVSVYKTADWHALLSCRMASWLSVDELVTLNDGAPALSSSSVEDVCQALQQHDSVSTYVCSLTGGAHGCHPHN